MEKRRELRQMTIEDCLGRSLALLIQKEQDIEKAIEQDFADGNIEALEVDETNKWVPFRNELNNVRFSLTLSCINRFLVAICELFPLRRCTSRTFMSEKFIF